MSDPEAIRCAEAGRQAASGLLRFPRAEHRRSWAVAAAEPGRRRGQYIRKGKRLRAEFDKRSYIEKYIPHIGIALQEILDLTDPDRDATVKTLDDVLQKSRKF